MAESEQQAWYLAERARALAVVHLTRRDDLTVRPAAGLGGLDLLVGLKAERSLRQFGVFLRAGRTATTAERLDETLRPLMLSLTGAAEFPYPACLLYFTMDDDRGYFTWVAEPTLTDAEPRLVLHGEAHVQTFDRPALDDAVTRVNAWYDAFFSRIAVKAS